MTESYTTEEVKEEFEQKVQFDIKSRQIDKKLPTQDRHKAVFKALRGLQNKKIADIGCGYGLIAIELVKRGIAASCSAIDLSPSRIEIAKQHALKQGVLDKIMFQDGEATHTPYESDQFDYVVCTEVLEHAADKEELLRELKRIVKPGGKIFVTNHDPEAIWSLANILYSVQLFFKLRFRFEKERPLTEKEMSDLSLQVGLQVVYSKHIGIGGDKLFMTLTK